MDVNQLHQTYQQLWEDAIATGIAQGVFRQINKVAVKAMMGMFFYSSLWLKSDGPQTADEVGDVFSDLIIHSLLPNTARKIP